MKKVIFIFSLIAVCFAVSCNKKSKTPVTTIEPSPLPTVETTPVLAISDNTATCGGKVVSEGTSLVTAVGVCWDTNHNPTTLRDHTTDGAGTGTFASQMSILKPGTVYYVRAYASNASGTAYGAELSFKTLGVWTFSNNTLPPGMLYELTSVDSSLYVGTDEGIYSTVNKGTSWFPLNAASPDYHVIEIATIGANTIVAGGYNINGNKCYVSKNNGNTWTLAGTSLPSDPIRDIATSGNNIFVALVNNKGVYLSTNMGVNWAAVNNGLTELAVSCLCVVGNTLLAGTDVSGVFISTDNGSSWTQSNTGLTSTGISAMASNGSNIFVGTPKGLFVSNDKGKTWKVSLGSVAAYQVGAVCAKGSTVCFSTPGKFFVSFNGGTTYTEASKGLGSAYGTSLEIFQNAVFMTSSNWGGMLVYPL